MCVKILPSESNTANNVWVLLFFLMVRERPLLLFSYRPSLILYSIGKQDTANVCFTALYILMGKV
jgi:hypothetical protein